MHLFVDKSKVPTINDDRLKSLCILTYSDNVELQRSAALCFAEFSDRSKCTLGKWTMGWGWGAGLCNKCIEKCIRIDDVIFAVN